MINSKTVLLNCYALKSDDMELIGAGRGTQIDVSAKTAEEFYNGDVLALLANGCEFEGTVYDGSVWGQDFSKAESYPMFGEIIGTTNKIVGHSIQVGGTTELTFYVTFRDITTIEDTDYMEFSFEGKVFDRVLVKDAKETVYQDVECYAFTCNIPISSMTGTIAAVMYNAETVIASGSCDVKVAVNDILNDTSNPEATQEVQKVTSMLNYSGYVQSFFYPEEDNIANENLFTPETDPVLNTAVVIEEEKYTFTKPVDVTGLTYYGSSLKLEADITLYHYFVLDKDAKLEDYTVTYAGQTLQLENKGVENGSQIVRAAISEDCSRYLRYYI